MATKSNEPLPPGPILEAPGVFKAHQEAMKQLRAEQDANRDEMLRCCNPSYAAECEMKKPVYKWRIACTVHESDSQDKKKDRFDFDDDDGPADRFKPRQIEGTVVAQNESDAWANFCDRIKMWPSRRYAKPIIKRLEQVDPFKVASKKVSTAQGER